MSIRMSEIVESRLSQFPLSLEDSEDEINVDPDPVSANRDSV
jgi:hypothetical protein